MAHSVPTGAVTVSYTHLCQIFPKFEINRYNEIKYPFFEEDRICNFMLWDRFLIVRS